MSRDLVVEQVTHPYPMPEKPYVNGTTTPERFECLDCGVNVSCAHGICETYMVHNHVWKRYVGHGHAGMVCVACLEKRMGRRLSSADFTDCPANIDTRASRRLKARRSDGMTDQHRALRILIKEVESGEPMASVVIEYCKAVS